MTPLPRAAAPERPGSLPFAPTFDYSADGVHRSLEQSLLRLGMDRVDIVFIHDVNQSLAALKLELAANRKGTE